MGANQISPNSSQQFLKHFQNTFHFYKELNDRIFGYTQVYKNNTPLPELEEWEYSFIARSGKRSVTDEQLENKIQSAKKCMNLKHKNLLRVFSVTEQSQEILCGGMDKLNIYFEYYFHNLEVEIKERARKKIYFSEDELKALLITMINGMVYLGANQIPQSNYIPSRVYLKQDGEIKIGTFFPWAENTLTLQQMQREFFAPEIMTRINYPRQFEQYNSGNDEKSLIFSMGITLMEAASLKPLHLGFDIKKNLINFSFFWDLLNYLSSRYSRNFIKIIAMMIAQEKEVRPTATQIIHAMSEHEAQKIQIQPLQVSQIIPNLALSNLQHSGMFSHQGLNISQISAMPAQNSSLMHNIKSPALFSPLGVKNTQLPSQLTCSKKSIIVNRQTRKEFMTPQRSTVFKKNIYNSSIRVQQSPIKSPIQQQSQKPIQQLIQQPIQYPVQRPIQQPIQLPIQQPIQYSVQRPIQQPIQLPIQQPIQRPIQYPVQRPIQQSIQQPFQQSIQCQRQIVAQPVEASKLVNYNNSSVKIIKINQLSQFKNVGEVLPIPHQVQMQKGEKQIEELVSELTQKKKLEEEVTEATQKQDKEQKGEVYLKQEEFEEEEKKPKGKEENEEEEEENHEKENKKEQSEKESENEKSDEEKEKHKEEKENKEKEKEKNQEPNQALQEIEKEKSVREQENILKEENLQKIDDNKKEQEEEKKQNNESEIKKMEQIQSDQELFEKMSSEEFENEEEDEYDKINNKILMAIKLSENTIIKLRNIEQQEEKFGKDCEKKESLTELYKKYVDETQNEPEPHWPEEAEKGVSFSVLDNELQDHNDKFKKKM